MKAKVIRIGRYWFDRKLHEEGYRPEDIFEMDDPVVELPELLAPLRSENRSWLKCPECGECSPVPRFSPSCVHCGWSEEDADDDSGLPCAA